MDNITVGVFMFVVIFVGLIIAIAVYSHKENVRRMRRRKALAERNRKVNYIINKQYQKLHDEEVDRIRKG